MLTKPPQVWLCPCDMAVLASLCSKEHTNVFVAQWPKRALSCNDLCAR